MNYMMWISSPSSSWASTLIIMISPTTFAFALYNHHHSVDSTPQLICFWFYDPWNIMMLISLWPSIVHTSELTSNHCQHYDVDFTLAEWSMFAVCFRFDLSLQTVESCQLGPVSLLIDCTNTCTWNQIKSNQIIVNIMTLSSAGLSEVHYLL